MTKTRQLKYRGEFEHHAEATAALGAVGEFAFVVRGVPRSIVMKCPDGCGDVISVNLDARSGKAWRADVRSNALSLYPSVWRSEGCKAHFIVWKNAVLWFDEPWERLFSDESIPEQIKKLLDERRGQFVHYETLAQLATVHPWEALWACRLLERRHEVVSKKDGFFAVEEEKSFGKGKLV